MLLGAPLGECMLIAKAFRSVRSDNTSIDLDKVSPANATKLGDVRPRDDPRGTTDGGRSKTASRALGREIRLLMPTTEQRRLMARNTHTFPGAQSNGGFFRLQAVSEACRRPRLAIFGTLPFPHEANWPGQ